MRDLLGIPIPQFDRVLKSSREQKLEEALRKLVEPLLEAASGSIKGPDVEDILTKAGLISWHTFDSSNPEHEAIANASRELWFEDGDRFWLLTDFGREIVDEV